MSFVGAIDQGTTSTRFMIFDAEGAEIARHQMEHDQIMLQPGWVEHDPVQILKRTESVVGQALQKAGISSSELAALGITNQRETTIVWNPRTGEPWFNAVVWQDTRSEEFVKRLVNEGHEDLIRHRTGLVPATYFSAPKIQWILNHVPGVREASGRGEAIFGNPDSWLIWNLTGGPDGGHHVTDVTNASRTMLMNLRTLDWDDELLDLFGLSRSMLPDIRPSSDPLLFGMTRPAGPFSTEVPIGGVLGDQQAATLGQGCHSPGEAKNTYGTGNFLVLNTGEKIYESQAGLISTVCYQIGDAKPVYALEGSIAVTGSAVQWLRDQLGIIQTSSQVEALAGSVPDCGGLYFVPAFSGLFAPYWRADARGVIVGISRYHTAGHLARAALEAIGYQSRDVIEAMVQDSGVRLEVLKVDGGATLNETLMQLQADILGVPVVRPQVAETTALGAAYAAGLAVGVWKDLNDLRQIWKADRIWEPRWGEQQREAGYAAWKEAVKRTLDWAR